MEKDHIMRFYSVTKCQSCSKIVHFLYLLKSKSVKNIVTTALQIIFFIFISVTPTLASLQQALLDGKAGRFKAASSELRKLSEQLEAEVTSADFMIVGRNSAALGFYTLLHDISSNCISNRLEHIHGKKLFTAGQYATLGQFEKAASLINEVVNSKPNYQQAQLFLGRIYMGTCIEQKRRCYKAIQIYEKAIEVDRSLVVAYFDLGILYQHTGQNKQAIEAWEKITEIVQGNAVRKWAHLMLAVLYSAEQKWNILRVSNIFN